MASERQIAANRRNAARSTGPRTAGGKLRSRRNAYRHGLTAETVITSLESTSDYQRLEAGLFDEYRPHGAVEEALVARLASLLWRLQRATLIESGLFEIEGCALQNRTHDQLSHESSNPALEVFYRLLHKSQAGKANAVPTAEPSAAPTTMSVNAFSDADVSHRRKIDTSSVYLRLCRAHPNAMKRLGRYETALWRQFAQTLLLLETAMSNSLSVRKLFPSNRIK